MTNESINSRKTAWGLTAMVLIGACGAGLSATAAEPARAPRATAAAGSASAPSAPSAEPSAAKSESGEYRVEKHRGASVPAVKAESVEGTNSNMYLTTESGPPVRVRQTDDEVRISVRGKRLATERVTDDSWSELRIMDAGGEVLATIIKNENGHLSAVSGEWTEEKQREMETAMKRAEEAQVEARQAQAKAMDAYRDAAKLRSFSFSQGGGGSWAQQPGGFGTTLPGQVFAAGPVPKVMMGVNMDRPHDSVAHQVGVDPDESTLITSVTEGLPAAKAGLQEYDIIVKVDGQTPAGEADVRKALRSKNPGDELKLEVLRKGETKQITVALEAYDGSKLNPFAVARSGGFGQGGVLAPEPQGATLWGDEDERAELEEKHQALAQLSEKLAEMSAKMTDQQGAAARDAAKQMAALGEKMSKLSTELAEKSASQTWNLRVPAMQREMLLRDLQGQRRSPRMRIETLAPGAPPRITVIPAEPGLAVEADEDQPEPESGELSEHVQKLDREMSTIDDRLKRLEELLEQVVEAKKAGGKKNP